ncbi:MAG: hypothetical protein ACI4D8_00805 [Wujia sp.]
MDEDYLDGLLDELSSKDEKNNSFADNMDLDSSVDLDMDDLGDISLEELDDLDNLDLGDLDFDDIDFDDIDVTSLDTKPAPKQETNQDVGEDFNLDNLIHEEPSGTEDKVVQDDMDDLEKFLNSDGAENASDDYIDSQNVDIPTQDNMVTDSFLKDDDEGNVFEEAEKQETQDTSISAGDMDLDSLFSALGIEDEITEQDKNPEDNADTSFDDLFESASLGAEGLFEDIEELDDTKVKPKSKKEKGEKRTFSEILFGEPDEDDEEEERLLLIRKEQKKEKKEQKKADKEAKKAEKASILAAKKQKEDNAKKEKALKKKAELEAELEEEKEQKQVPTPVVIIVFLLFAALGGLVYFGSQFFHYSEVIRKATDYFDRQRYRLAYDEVSGVEIKEKDEDLRDRIYTVMYVERLYESYENNMTLGRPDKALDALIRGLEKYDEHYEEAIELEIVDDIDLCKTKIIAALASTYGMSENDAYDVMELEGQEYNQALLKWCEKIQTGE